MFLRYLVVSLVGLMLALGPGVVAEENVFCGDLPTADCDLLMANATTMNALDSVVYDLDFGFGGIMDEGEPIEFVFTSNGTVFLGHEEINRVKNEVLDTTIRQILEMVENEAFVEHVVDLTERVLMAPAVDMDLALTIMVDNSDGPTSFNAQIKYVDGTLYLTSPMLAMAMPGFEPGQWLGVELVRGLHMVVEMMQDPALLEGIFSGAGGGFGGFPNAPGGPADVGMGGGDFENFFGQISALANADYWKKMETAEYEAQFTQMVRREDEMIGSTPVAVYQTLLDFGKMVETEQFQQSFHDILVLQTQMQGLEPAQAEALVPIIMDMVAEMDMEFIEKIGIEDHYTYSISATWALTINPADFVAAFANEDELAEIPQEELPPMDLEYYFTLALNDHNQPVKIDAPEDFVSVIDMMIGMMTGME